MNTLAVLATLGVAVSTVLLVVRSGAERSRRPPASPDATLHDLYEVAFLNGGPARVADTALTALHADGRLAVGGPGIVAVQRSQANDPVERAVFQELAAAPNGALHVLREAVMRHPAVQEVGDGLAARGLLVAPHRLRPLRRWAVLQGVACLVALPLSLVLTFVQYAMDDSAPFAVPFLVKMLPAILIGGLTGLIVAGSSASRITQPGRDAVLAFRTAHTHISTPAHLVATMGPSTLLDPVFRDQLMAAARLSAPRRRPSGGVGGATATGTGGRHWARPRTGGRSAWTRKRRPRSPPAYGSW
ncbi:TIGR04222 domain-containing membrane protein [Streptomyces griseus]|uniref:TIGR04222 domain-containing membrane protein n=1 Tax=Streptomyces griseus TaxID=1911 RepID=UPI00214B15E8|nr:TIGR04222 domain-containing membrane protein [Streptomyces griseus]